RRGPRGDAARVRGRAGEGSRRAPDHGTRVWTRGRRRGLSVTFGVVACRTRRRALHAGESARGFQRHAHRGNSAPQRPVGPDDPWLRDALPRSRQLTTGSGDRGSFAEVSAVPRIATTLRRRRGARPQSVAQRLAGAGALDDQPVVFGPPVLGEVENVLAEGVAQREVAVDRDHFVVLGHALRGDLAGGRDDTRAADHVKAVLVAALGR